MNKKWLIVAMVAFLLAAGGLGAQQQGGPMMGQDGQGGMMGGDPNLGVGQSMMRTPQIRSERDFVAEMIPHHLEAIDAAILEYTTTQDETLRELTEQIYKSQFQEVEQLKLHFARTYQQLPAGRRYMPMMRDLSAVRGEARDLQFVQDMIPHHQSAAQMARQALELPDLSEEMRRLAQKVIDDQEREIGIMQEWLSRQGG